MSATRTAEQIQQDIQSEVVKWKRYCDTLDQRIRELYQQSHFNAILPIMAKMRQLQARIDELEQELTAQRIPYLSTVLMLPDATPPEYPEGYQDYDQTEYEAWINRIETSYDRIKRHINTIIREYQTDQAYKIRVIRHHGETWQKYVDDVVKMGSVDINKPLRYRTLYDGSILTGLVDNPPRITRYPFDPTGLHPANLVSETRTISVKTTPDQEYKFILPTHLPFFVDGLKVKRALPSGEFIDLVINEDFYTSGLFGELSEHTMGGKLVASVILFDDRDISGDYVIQYQTLGGPYTLDSKEYAIALANYLETPYLRTYADLVGKPLVLDPVRHRLDVGDLTNLESFLPILNEISGALRRLALSNERERADNAGLEDVLREADKLRIQSEDLLANFQSSKGSLERQVNAIQANFDGLADTLRREATTNFNRQADALLAKTNKANDTLNKSLRNYVSTQIQTASRTFDQKAEQMQNEIAQSTNERIRQELQNVPTQEQIEGWISTQVDATFSPIPTQIQALERTLSQRIDGNHRDYTNFKTGLSTEIQTAINNNVDPKIRIAKQEATKATELAKQALESRISTDVIPVLSELQTRFNSYVPKSDASYVKYVTSNRKRTIVTDELSLAGKVLRATNQGIESPNTLKVHDVVFNSSAGAATTLSTIIGTLGQTDSTHAAQIEQLRQSLNGKIPPAHASGIAGHVNTFVQRDGEGNIRNIKSIAIGDGLLAATISTNDQGVLVSRTLMADDLKFQKDGQWKSVEEELYNIATSVRQATTKNTQQDSTLKTLESRRVALTRKVDNLERAQQAMRDRVQTTEDSQTSATMVGKAPVVQQGGTTYMSQKLIMTPPDYNRNAAGATQKEIALTYTTDARSNTKSLDINALISVQNIALTSDERLKEDIKEVNHPLEILRKLKGYRYVLKRNQTPSLGVLAQELLPVLPELVYVDEEGYYGVEYHGLIAVLIEAMKAQDSRLAAIESRLATLERMIK